MSKSSYSQVEADSEELTLKSTIGGGIGTIVSAFKAAAKIAEKGAKTATSTTVLIAENAGFKDKFEAAGKAANKLAEKGRYDAKKRINKAMRMASRAIDFEEEDDDTHEFDLLLSAAGAVTRTIPIHGHHSETYSVPIHQKLVWKVQVKRHDIGIMVKERKGLDGSFVEIEPLEKCKSKHGETAIATQPTSITITFDNSHSLQSKTICYWVFVGENATLALLEDNVKESDRNREIAAADQGPPE